MPTDVKRFHGRLTGWVSRMSTIFSMSSSSHLTGPFLVAKSKASIRSRACLVDRGVSVFASRCFTFVCVIDSHEARERGRS